MNRNLLLCFLAFLTGINFSFAQSDNCSTATSITPGATCVYTSGSSSGATQSLSGCSGTADDDVWYKFTATATSHQITVDPSASYDAVVELFSGSCASLVTINCVDVGYTDGNEVINATGLTIGSVYYIRVYDYYTGSGSNTFQICVSAAPAAPSNNNCSGVTTLSVNTSCTYTAGTSLNATQSQTGCVGTANDDVWYKFVATNTYANITVDPSATGDPVVEMFSGTCASLSSMYCTDNGYTDGTETINAVGLTTGNTYYIRVYDYYSGNGTTFDVCVTANAASGTPNNDALCSAFIWPTVTSDCNYYQFTTVGATTSIASYIPTPVSCGGSAPARGGFGNTSNDVWFKIIVPSNGKLSINDDPNFAGAITDGAMALYSTANAASCTATLTQIACNDDGGAAAHSLLNVSGLTPGNTVYLRYWPYDSTSAGGPFKICISSPTNDACASALYICDLNGYSASTSSAYTDDSRPGGDGEMYGNNETPTGGSVAVNTNSGGPFGTNLNGDNGSANGPTGYDVTIDNGSWIIFTASATTAVLNITVADCWYNNGMQMQIFSGTNCTNFTAVSDFKESANGTFTLSASGLTIGSNYYLLVDGFAADVCNYTITANSGVAFPDITTSSSSSVCSGDAITLTGPAGATSYEWLPGGQTTQSITVSPATTITYYCIAGGTCGYKQTLSKTVTVNPLPVPNIANSTNACQTTTGNVYNVTAVAGNSYSWSITGGTITAGSISNSATVTWGSGTTGQMIVTQTINATGCDNKDTINVTLNPLPTPAISPTTAACVSSTGNTYSVTAVAGHTYAWTISGGTITSGTTGNSVTVTWGTGASGTITCTETITATTCSKQVSQTITLNALPTPVITPTANVCPGATVNYSVTNVAGHTYSWSITNGTINSGATSNTVNVTWGTSASGTLTCTETITATTCSKTVTQIINFNSLPSPSITGNATVCEASTGNVYSVTPVAGNTYAWTISGGTITSGTTGNSVTVTWGSGASGTITCTQTITATTCSAADTKTVTINPLPTPAITPTSAVCAASTGNVYSVTAVAGHTYTWTISGGTITSGTTGNSVTVTWGSGASGTITCTETITATTCSKQVSQTITLNPLPTPVITPTANVCPGATVNYSVTNVAGHTYSWSITNGTINSGATSNSVNVTWGSGASGTLTCTETITATTCSNSITQTINFNSLPTPSITGNTTVCETSTGNVYSVTAVSGNTYAWTISGGTITSGTTGNSVTVTWGSGASGTITCTQTITASTCVASDSKTITINPLPAPTITPTSAVCANSAGNVYSVTSVAGHTYAWTISGGTITSGTTGNSVTVTWGSGASGTITCTETITATTCSKQVSQTITLNALPAPVISPTTNICEGATATYSVSNIIGHGYTWSISNGTINSGAATNSVNVTWGSGVSGTLTCTETITATTCAAAVSQTINFNPLPAPVISGNAVACANSTGNAYSVSTVSGNSHVWSITGGTITAGSASNSATVSWGSGASGQLIITQTVTATTCSNKDTLDVVINPLPNPVITPTSAVCAGATGISYSTASIAGHSYSWGVTGGNIASGQSSNTVSVDWGAGGTGNVTVTETIDATTCTASANVPITIQPNDDPSFSFSSATYCQTAGNPTANITGGATGIFSASPAGLVFTNNTTGLINLAASTQGTYTITFTTGGTCSSSSSISLTITSSPSAAFSYGSSNYCEDGGSNPLPVFGAGASGGTFGATPAGLNFVNANTGEIDLANTAPGNYTITNSIASGASGCAATSATATVIIDAAPNPVIAGNTNVCENSTAIPYSVSGTGNSYAWIVTGGTISSGQGTNTIAVDWANNGTGLISLTEINASNCTTTVNQAIVINALPAPNISGPSPLYSACSGAAGMTYSVTSNSGNSYSWTVTGGTITSVTNNNTADIDWGTGTTGIVSVTETNNLTTCAATDTLNITILPLDNATFNYSSGVYCQSGTDPIPTSAVSGTYTSNPAGLVFVNNATGEIDLSASATGTYIITFTTGAICPNSSTQSLTISNAPAATFSYSSPDYCAYSSSNPIPVLGSGANAGVFSASPSGLSFVNVNTGEIDLANTAPGSYTITNSITSGSSGCAATSDSATVNINALPTPVISGPTPLYSACSGATGVTYNLSSTANTYTWIVTGGTIASGQGSNSINVDWGTGTTGFISVSETDPSTNCSATDTLNITILPLDNPTFNYSSGVYCQTGTDPIPTSTVSGTYTSSPAGLVFVNNTTGEIDLSASAIGTYTITFTTNAVCSNTSTQSVTISNAPSAAFTFSAYEYCHDAANVFPVLGTGFAGIFSASPAGLVFVNTSSGEIDLSASAAGTYVVTNDILSGTSGCAATSDTSYITINALPNPVITGNLNACENTAANVYSVTASGNTMAWTVTGGSISSGQGSDQINVDWGANGSGQVNITETSTAGCSGTASVNVTVNANPTPSVSGNTGSVCESSTGTYTATSSGNNYNWVITGGTITSGQGTNSITVDWGTAGAGQVSLTETIANCSATVDSMITINPLPSTNVTGQNTICQNATGVIYSTVNNSGNSYVWTVSGGMIAAGQGTNTVSVDWPVAGAGSVSVTETNTLGCSSTSSINSIAVNPLPAPNILGAAAVCQNVSGNIYSTSGSGDIYTWTVSGGTITSGQGTNTITVDWSATGVQTVTLIDSATVGNCAAIVTIPVNVNPVPVIDASSSSVADAICGLTNGSISGITITGGSPVYTYTWTDAQGTVISSDTISPDLNNLGAGSYQLTITDANGCISAQIAPFAVASFNSLIAAFTADTTSGYAPIEIHFTNQSQNADTYSWNFGDNSDLNTLLNPSHIFTEAGTYDVVLTATSNIGCTDTAMIRIILETDYLVVIPNIFTPNGDNSNDIFKVLSNGSLKEVEGTIYNRWGEQLYDWTGVHNGWDGRTVSGTTAQAGVYFYLIKTIDIKGVEKSYQGTVTLIR